jgi:hypothetical protein
LNSRSLPSTGSQLLHVRSDLAGICEYACIRRKTNRAASAGNISRIRVATSRKAELAFDK